MLGLGATVDPWCRVRLACDLSNDSDNPLRGRAVLVAEPTIGGIVDDAENGTSPGAEKGYRAPNRKPMSQNRSRTVSLAGRNPRTKGVQSISLQGPPQYPWHGRCAAQVSDGSDLLIESPARVFAHRDHSGRRPDGRGDGDRRADDGKEPGVLPLERRRAQPANVIAPREDAGGGDLRTRASVRGPRREEAITSKRGTRPRRRGADGGTNDLSQT